MFPVTAKQLREQTATKEEILKQKIDNFLKSIYNNFVIPAMKRGKTSVKIDNGCPIIRNKYSLNMPVSYEDMANILQENFRDCEIIIEDSDSINLYSDPDNDWIITIDWS